MVKIIRNFKLILILSAYINGKLKLIQGDYSCNHIPISFSSFQWSIISYLIEYIT